MLYTPQDSPEFDSDHKKFIEAEVLNIASKLSEGHSPPILSVKAEEVGKICKGLKSGKAPGWDGVTPEHLKYGGDVLHQYIAILVNSIIEHEYVPESFRKGVIVSLPKADKDQLYRDNYRGITLLPVLSKVYDKVILPKTNKWFYDMVCDMQGAGQEKCSSLHTSLLLQETIAYHQERFGTVYAGFLDTKKAFDTVWIDGLLFKLYKSGIDGKIWRLIKAAYTGFQCSVMLNGELSNWFEASQGVHQGAVFSMRLYILFINDLLCEMRMASKGCHMYDTNCTCPSYADDITIISPFKKRVSELVNCAYQYSCKWRFTFGINKSALVCFGTDSMPKHEVLLGNQNLPQVTSYKHMGILLSTASKETQIELDRRADKVNRMYWAMQGIGHSSGGLNPLTASKLYWSVCLPSMAYGLEVWNLGKDFVRLEKAHIGFGKKIQGLPEHTSEPAALSMIGWLSLECYVEILKVLFLWRILLLPVNNIYRKIVISRLCSFFEHPANRWEGPTYNMYKIFIKYGLDKELRKSILHSQYDSLMNVKKRVRTLVWYWYKNKWKISCQMYKKLEFFRSIVTDFTQSFWWKLAKENSTKVKHYKRVVKLLCGEHCLQVNVGRFSNIERRHRVCPICRSEVETVSHFLFNCTGLPNNEIIDTIMDNIPVHLEQWASNLTNDDLLVQIFSCFDTYLDDTERKVLGIKLACVISTRYSYRLTILKAMDN